MTAGYDPTPFRVSVMRSGRRARVQIAGELDVATAPELEAALDGLISSDPPDLIVVEAGALAFADVVGLGVLIDANDRLAPEGHLLLHEPARQIVRVLDLLGQKKLLALD